ncbi:MAG: hypothetical protein ACE364_06585 [Chlorobiota bacterium]
MIKRLVFIFSALIILNSCYNSTKYDLTIDKEPYFGNELRIDGYYYYQYYGNENEKYTQILFFYRDGVIFDGAIFPKDNFESIEQYFIDNEHVKSTADSWVWSTFKVNKDSLVYERWNPPTVSQGPEPILYYCEIINDSTFKVYKQKLHSQKEFDKVNLTYHFRQFDHKPDSTNRFID